VVAPALVEVGFSLVGVVVVVTVGLTSHCPPYNSKLLVLTGQSLLKSDLIFEFVHMFGTSLSMKAKRI